MNVMILETDSNIGLIWQRHLERYGVSSVLISNEADAVQHLQRFPVDVLVINLLAEVDSSLALTDLATYKNPDVAIIGVTARNFFSDGSLFDVIPNMRGFLGAPVKLDDLTALVQHYGNESSKTSEHHLEAARR
jgi:DNA-binding NtrC family response regulator